MNKKEKQTETTPVEGVNSFASNIQIGTTDDAYKTDGSVVIGYRNNDNTYTPTNSVLPEKIDIEQRKKEKRELIKTQNNNATINYKERKEAKKVQSIVAIVVLVLFIGVGAFFYYQKNYANNKDFTLKAVHVEFGNPASLRIADYVNLSNPDEKLFILDLSAFTPDKIGEYKYRITYSGVTKIGIIEVSDTKAPDIVLKELKLNSGDTYTPEMFVKECNDFSGCIITFDDGLSVKTANEVGRNTVSLIIKDKLGNQITKEATINVKSTDTILACEKDNGYNYSLGYKTIENYEIYISKDNLYKNSILKTINIYVDNNDYLEFKKKNDNENYTYEDNLSKVTKETPYTNGFGNNNTISTISSYLGEQGYTCVIKKQ